MPSPYGQPQPGYGQPGYAPLDGGYAAPYGPYNGPASAFQPGAPPQGKTLLPSVFAYGESARRHVSFPAAGTQPWSVLLSLTLWDWSHLGQSSTRPVHPVRIFFLLLQAFSYIFTVFALLPSLLVFQVILLSQVFPLRLWPPAQSLTSPLLST